MIWNAYNRVGIEYIVASNPSALEGIQNPHFTYHPAMLFHLKDDGPVKGFLFRGIADVGITLSQDGVMPWIRATSAPLRDLPEGGRRADGVAVEDLAISSPNEDVSVRMAVDFIRTEDAKDNSDGGVLDLIWHAVAVRISLSFCPPQIATLSWFHFY